VRTLHRSRSVPWENGRTTPVSSVRTAHNPWLWMGGGILLFFAVPFVGADQLGLQPDWYYLCYFTVAVIWIAAFDAAYRNQLRDLWRLNWKWSLLVGALAGVGVTAIVIGQAGTDHPDGWRWWFEIGWRGVVYGTIDVLVLFVFPAAVAYLLMHGNRTGARRKVGYAGLALVLSVLMSSAYHLGYPEYQDSDLRSPVIGTVMANSSTMLTGNPVGAFLTHVPAHVSAVVHQEQGGPTQMLPPKVSTGYPNRGDRDLAAGFAALWIVGVAGAITVLVRGRRSGTE
jgi:hypothetical protein